jgi:hypothetical protein
MGSNIFGNSGGRPRKYTIEDMREALRAYKENHKNEEINISRLAKESDIPRTIWYARMKDDIHHYNATLVKTSTGVRSNDCPAININDYINELTTKEQKRGLNLIIDLVKELWMYKDVGERIEEMEARHKEELMKKDAQIKELQRMVENQQKVMTKYIVSSIDSNKRKVINIKENLLAPSKEAVQRYNDMFDEMLDDSDEQAKNG